MSCLKVGSKPHTSSIFRYWVQFTKWYLVIGSMERQNLLVLIVLLASSLLNAAYFVPIIYKAYFKEEDSDFKKDEKQNKNVELVKENPFMVIPLTLTALVSVILGIYPDFIIRIAKMVL